MPAFKSDTGQKSEVRFLVCSITFERFQPENAIIQITGEKNKRLGQLSQAAKQMNQWEYWRGIGYFGLEHIRLFIYSKRIFHF